MVPFGGVGRPTAVVCGGGATWWQRVAGGNGAWTASDSGMRACDDSGVWWPGW